MATVDILAQIDDMIADLKNSHRDYKQLMGTTNSYFFRFLYFVKCHDLESSILELKKQRAGLLAPGVAGAEQYKEDSHGPVRGRLRRSGAYDLDGESLRGSYFSNDSDDRLVSRQNLERKSQHTLFERRDDVISTESEPSGTARGDCAYNRLQCDTGMERTKESVTDSHGATGLTQRRPYFRV
eukprot:CAMPEP_0184644272 /NCGR_PEP_ID=MMETSP0308-20130426/1024_1 /TAXON_ID=38269 /ORGANISM="Gloeochaete witrockiana, Strain SAG 46.84" /LENGTH=182 /DNA_ID=CAMNT_0027072719 /DNA_START=54 /DNA_END=602 /DNA_ORIENTATION=+